MVAAFAFTPVASAAPGGPAAPVARTSAATLVARTSAATLVARTSAAMSVARTSATTLATSVAQATVATSVARANATAVTSLARAAPVTRAAATRHRQARRLRAYAWAATQTGHPYVWGGTGPGYDCSGLVMVAYRHAGIDLPRTTYEMLASRLLVRVWHPRMGDLAFYGSGHVELFRRWGYTLGAHDWDSPVGVIHYGRGWRPTAFYRVR